jgi:phosphohistidine phosphatase
MQIYVMRHGQAEMRAASDGQRELTDVGIRQSEQMADYFARKSVSFDAALISPYIRAQQTFAAVSSFFPQIKNQQTLRFLTPSGSARKTVNEIFALQASGVKSLLIVSHLPLVGYIVGELAPSAGVPAFSTSTIAHISLDDQGFATLNSLTAPSMMH